MTVRWFLIFIIPIFLFSCLTNNVKEKSNDFEIMLLEAQTNSNKGKYQAAIEILSNALIKFPNMELSSIYYNIGYNYYKLNNNNEATKYFNKVISMLENSNISAAEMEENRKFIILSELILEKMKKNEEDKKDPYHIKEEVEANKKIKAKR